MNIASRRLIVTAVAGLLAAVAAHVWRGYGIELAVVTGVAVGLLVFATQRTFDRLRDTVGSGER